jgi:tetratricopeptide (TPR) repeat protein
MIDAGAFAGRYYRLGLAAAKRRNLGAALAYADFSRALAPEHEGAVRLAEICRTELGEPGEIPEPELDRICLLAAQKKWKAAALAAKALSPQTVRLLNIRGCLWALAKRYGPAADCFTKALAKDRGNALAADALVCLCPRRNFLGGFFASL